VLRDALPEGEAILGATRGFVEVSTATAQEADAIRLRLDELRRILDQTERDAADATPSALFTTVSLPKLMRDVETTQGYLETADARVREAAPWDFVVRGGYERIFIASQGRPFFATGTISFNLGAIRQKDADRRAAAGKREWVREQPSGVMSRTARLIRQLQALARAEADRLQETRVLLSDLEQRIKSVQDVGGRKAKSYADYLWFDYIKLKAENAYLIAHIEDLANVTRDGSR
jgi:hypothetical protein